MEIEVPMIGVMAEDIGNNTIVLSLLVTTTGTMAKYFLCEASQNYQDVAKQLHDKICQAGNEARRAKSGLVIARDLPDSMKNGGRTHAASRKAKG